MTSHLWVIAQERSDVATSRFLLASWLRGLPTWAEGQAYTSLHAKNRKVRYHMLMKNSTMHRMITRHLGLLVAIGLLLAACTPAAAPGCGDGLCSSLEDGETCPQDCARTGLVRKTLTTYIDVEGIGNIAILVAYPNQGRFPEGTGVVVTVSPFYSAQQGFVTSPDFTSVGLIQVSYLWPGTTDEAFVMQSEGTNDFGGEQSLLALRDVIRFATGRLRDVNDRAIMSLVPMTPMVDEVGLYAFDGAGIAAVNVLARYGDALPGLAWFVGHENPTVDTLSCLEAGYYDGESFRPDIGKIYGFNVQSRSENAWSQVRQACYRDALEKITEADGLHSDLAHINNRIKSCGNLLAEMNIHQNNIK
ncbi:MAG: hypothetical protein HGB35_07485 [Geobacteraceae bacterium]|nr:hypothetical protein [Geobacteraceae bacterium]